MLGLHLHRRKPAPTPTPVAESVRATVMVTCETDGDLTLTPEQVTILVGPYGTTSLAFLCPVCLSGIVQELDLWRALLLASARVPLVEVTR